MKKCIGLVLFGLLIVAFSAPVYAQFEWKVSGYLDTNFAYYKNVYSTGQIYGGYADTNGNTTLGNMNKTGQYFNTRGRFKFDAAMGKDVTGTLFFEMDSTRWGEFTGGGNQVGKWKADQVGVEVKNLFIDFGIPYFGIPVPMTARLGIQPFVVRPDMAVNTEGTGITLGFKADPVTISPFWAKASHLKDYAAEDTDVFGTQLIAKIDKLTLGAYGVFYDMRTYPLGKSTTTITIDPSYKGRMFWFGGYADGKMGPMDMKADFVMDTGKVKTFGVASAPEVKYSGWATRLELSFPIEMFTVGARVVYATGSDAKKSDGIGLPGGHTSTLAHNSKVGSYVVPPGSEENSAFGANGSGMFYSNPITSRTPDFTGSSGGSMTRGSIGGTWFVQAFGSFKLAPWYKITALGTYIADTTKNGNTVGTAQNADGTPRDDKAIGWELGLFNEIQIYKNLSWGTVFSYMFANDGLDVYTDGRNQSPQNPYFIGSIVKYVW
ncbi:MAG: hypothetical protein WCO26_14975 [Deltaproteobacteria bacterium]